MKEPRHPIRTWEGGLLAIIAGTLVWWLKTILYQLVNILFLMYSADPSRSGWASFVSLLKTFVFDLPPAYVWQHNFMVGGVVGVLAYWIHTSPAPTERKRLWRWCLHSGIALFYFFYTFVGYILQGQPLWAILKLGVQMYGLLFLCVWILWRLMPLIDRVQHLLTSEPAPRRRYR